MGFKQEDLEKLLKELSQQNENAIVHLIDPLLKSLARNTAGSFHGRDPFDMENCHILAQEIAFDILREHAEELKKGRMQLIPMIRTYYRNAIIDLARHKKHSASGASIDGNIIDRKARMPGKNFLPVDVAYGKALQETYITPKERDVLKKVLLTPPKHGSHQEMASELGCERLTFDQRLLRAKKKLGKLGPEGAEAVLDYISGRGRDEQSSRC